MYTFGHDSTHDAGCVWAYKATPSIESTATHCGRCGKALERKPCGLYLYLEGGTSFPDVLGCGSYPYLIISDRFARLLADNDISGYRLHNCTIVHSQESDVALANAPAYYVVDVTGRCELGVDQQQLVSRYEKCPECKQGYLARRDPEINPFFVVTWDTQDVFRDAEAFPE